MWFGQVDKFYKTHYLVRKISNNTIIGDRAAILPTVTGLFLLAEDERVDQTRLRDV